MRITAVRILGLALAALIGLAGCAAERPRYPLYSAVQVTGSFGYFEEHLGGDRYRVGYRAPIRRAYSLTRAEREREAQRLINLSYDLALLRAAELAQAQGAAGFDIADRENNVEVNVHEGYAYDPLFPPFPHWHYRYYHYPYYPYIPYGPALYRDARTEVAVEVSFIATMKDEEAASEFVAAATIERVRGKYPELVTASAGT